MTLDIANGHVLLQLDLESVEIAQMIQSALKPETESIRSDRAMARVSVKNSTLVITITASDLTALRASMNSYLAWISSCKRTIETVTGQNP